MSSADPTVQKASQHNLDPKERLDEALELIKSIGNCLFTTTAPDGTLASRAMHAATVENLILSFYANTDSGKFDDIEAHPQVNVGYLDAKSGDWVSVSGTARVNKDTDKKKKHWSSSLKAWFDDKKDGKHTGNFDDPRVALIDVEPTEIRVFKADGKLKLLAHTAKAAVTGDVASGGTMFSINKQELGLLRSHFVK